jgi:hypothetical protein
MIGTLHFLKCDGCRTHCPDPDTGQTFYTSDVNMLRRCAEDSGWRRLPSNDGYRVDFCPACSAARRHRRRRTRRRPVELDRRAAGEGRYFLDWANEHQLVETFADIGHVEGFSKRMSDWEPRQIEYAYETYLHQFELGRRNPSAPNGNARRN